MRKPRFITEVQGAENEEPKALNKALQCAAEYCEVKL